MDWINTRTDTQIKFSYTVIGQTSVKYICYRSNTQLFNILLEYYEVKMY